MKPQQETPENTVFSPSPRVAEAEVSELRLPGYVIYNDAVTKSVFQLSGSV